VKLAAGLGGGWVWYGALLTVQGPVTACAGVPLMLAGAGLLALTIRRR
jgi:hypothetical protein